MHLEDNTVGTVTVGSRVVRRLGFGAARVARVRDATGALDREAGRALVRRAYDRGVNFIDVAALYGAGQCERIIAEALHPYSADLMIGSKAGFVPGPGGPSSPIPDGRPEAIKATCELSLERLRIDVIDLYQIHVPDPGVPWDDIVGAFADLRTEGKIRHVGLSNVSLEQLTAASAIVPIASVQNRYTVGHRHDEPMLHECEARGIPYLPWSPNLLGDSPAVAVLADIVAAHGVSPQQVGVRWLLHHSPVMLPIPGTTQLAHVDDNVDTAWLELTHDELNRLDEIAPPRTEPSRTQGSA